MKFNQTILAEFIDTLESGNPEALPAIADRLLEDESVLTSATVPVDFPEDVPSRVEILKQKAEHLKWAKADCAWMVLIPEIASMVLQCAELDKE